MNRPTLTLTRTMLDLMRHLRQGIALRRFTGKHGYTDATRLQSYGLINHLNRLTPAGADALFRAEKGEIFEIPFPAKSPLEIAVDNLQDDHAGLAKVMTQHKKRLADLREDAPGTPPAPLAMDGLRDNPLPGPRRPPERELAAPDVKEIAEPVKPKAFSGKLIHEIVAELDEAMVRQLTSLGDGKTIALHTQAGDQLECLGLIRWTAQRHYLTGLGFLAYRFINPRQENAA